MNRTLRRGLAVGVGISAVLVAWPSAASAACVSETACTDSILVTDVNYDTIGTIGEVDLIGRLNPGGEVGIPSVGPIVGPGPTPPGIKPIEDTISVAPLRVARRR